ncbi:MAG TPA: porin, partial [Prolixibacteraceae bacterium]|nr:porin [Prolixibacteraceae bacterium]
MKKRLLTILTLGVFVLNVYAQSTDEILNILVQKKVIAPKEADSLRAEAAIAAQASLSKVKAFPVNASKKISLSGYSQVRYQALEEASKMDGFDIRRARLDVKGNISPYWGYRVQFDLAGTPKLIDAFVELKLNDYINFTVGQAKVPFSQENMLSSTQLTLIDRSQVVEALTARGKDVIGNQNGRDIGVQMGGTLLILKDRPVVDYRLGLFNGSGINTVDNNENKDYAARLILHPLAGLDISGAYYDGSRLVPEVRSGNVVTSPATTVNRDRYGIDLSYDLKNFSLRSEYIHGTDDQVAREGYYVMGGYSFFQKKLQLVAKYDFYDTNKAIADNASEWVVIGTNYAFN